MQIQQSLLQWNLVVASNDNSGIIITYVCSNSGGFIELCSTSADAGNKGDATSLWKKRHLTSRDRPSKFPNTRIGNATSHANLFAVPNIQKPLEHPRISGPEDPSYVERHHVILPFLQFPSS